MTEMDDEYTVHVSTTFPVKFRIVSLAASLL